MEMLTSTEGLGHALRRCLNVVVGYDDVRSRVPVPLPLFMSHQYSFLWKHTNHIFSSLCIYFLLPSQF
ncbi:hypothetical protein HKD37_14G041138 [Glycine soja]